MGQNHLLSGCCYRWSSGPECVDCCWSIFSHSHPPHNSVWLCDLHVCSDDRGKLCASTKFAFAENRSCGRKINLCLIFLIFLFCLLYINEIKSESDSSREKNERKNGITKTRDKNQITWAGALTFSTISSDGFVAFVCVCGACGVHHQRHRRSRPCVNKRWNGRRRLSKTARIPRGFTFYDPTLSLGRVLADETKEVY